MGYNASMQRIPMSGEGVASGYGDSLWVIWVEGDGTMAIPDFQSMMLPVLRYYAEEGEHTNQEALDYLAEKFQLTPEERRDMLPSGQARTFDNRVAWARTHLKKAGLLARTRPGVHYVTEAARTLLSKNPQGINLKFLRSLPTYQNALGSASSVASQPGSGGAPAEGSESDDPGATPTDRMEEAYQTIREELAAELLATLKGCTPSMFEQIVVDVLVKMGYGGSRKDAGQVVGQVNDGGIDGIIKEDRLGLDKIYVQAKRWDSPVPRPEIQKFTGALQGQRASKGVFITTSTFTENAREYVRGIESKIVLVDGEELARYMIDFNVGVTTESTYEVKRLDNDYFTD